MKRTRQEKIRLGLIFVLVIGFFSVVAARLVHLQIVLSPAYSEIVSRQSSGKVSIPASRGIIYDRNGRVVANNVTLASLYAYPQSTRELRSVTEYVEKLFGLEKGTAQKKFGLAVKKFRWIKRRLDDDLAGTIAEAAPRGLYLRKETQREYPFGLIGKQILGFTDIDNCGQSGFELAFDSMLAGQQGWADIRRDGLRNTFRVKETALVKPVPGQSLLLTVDWRLQEILEEELQKGVFEHNARSGMAVFLDCNSGEVLAMAHYDPTEEHPTRPTKLRPVTDQFEPGSVFKAITAAGLIDDGLIDYSDSVYCEDGKWRVGRRILHDDKKHEWLNFRQIIELSSNIGIGKLAVEWGGEELYEVAGRFGIGRKARIGLPGETAGRLVRPSRWSDYNVASLAMGHAVAVNALQMASAFGAIANGGELLRPRLVLGQVDNKGDVINRSTRELECTAMLPETADTLRSLLRGVVERGTAEVVNSPMVTIAGKTGTAQIPDLVNGGYLRGKYNASFAGFFPAENPLIAGIVVLEAPRPVTYGGLTSGPVMRRIAERYSILHPDLFAVPERMMAEKSRQFHNTVEIPDLVGRELTQAEAIAGRCGLAVRADGDEGHVVGQYPGPDRLAFEGDQILIKVVSGEDAHRRMADLRGLSIRQVSAFLDMSGINFRIEGNGKVVKQSIKPGELIDLSAECRLECRPS